MIVPHAARVMAMVLVAASLSPPSKSIDDRLAGGGLHAVVQDQHRPSVDQIVRGAGGNAVGQVAVAPNLGRGLRRRVDHRLEAVLPLVVIDHRAVGNGRHGDIGVHRLRHIRRQSCRRRPSRRPDRSPAGRPAPGPRAWEYRKSGPGARLRRPGAQSMPISRAVSNSKTAVNFNVGRDELGKTGADFMIISSAGTVGWMGWVRASRVREYLPFRCGKDQDAIVQE